VPDLELSAGYRSLPETGDRTWLLGLSLPLPLFDRNQGALAEAQALVSRSEADVRRQEIELDSRLAGAFTTTGLARERALTLRERILPAAESAFQEIKAGYERGRFSYVDLLEARRAWAESRQAEVEARLQYHLALAETEFLLGIGLVHTTGEFRGGDSR
jgi:cobalt-zinc-cadmium efflux system outer membrane protein